MRTATSLLVNLLLPITLFAQDNVSPASTDGIRYQSGMRQVPLLELYTSEGCSSCPPADQWLSGLVNEPRLWSAVVPVAFHVDYWNYLGWQDRFSSSDNSERQRSHAQHGNIRTVYTPGFILNGQEWRAWFQRPQWGSAATPDVGALTVIINGNHATAEFQPKQKTAQTLQLNCTWLGFNLTTPVQNGENKGRELRHDFVSYHWQQFPARPQDGAYRWTFELPPKDQLPEKKALVFWVSDSANPKPIQATGGWYPSDH